MKLNKNFKNLKENYLFAEVSRRVDAYNAEFPNSDLISLGIGDVTIPLSVKASDACKDAAIGMTTKTGFHGYGPYDGYKFLKDAVVDYYKKRGIEIHADEVFITDGAKNGIGNFLDLFESGNTVMIPDPVYPAYVDANILAGNKIVYVDATKNNKFLAMPPKRGKADIIYLCSPNNPTGATYTQEQLKAWVEFALANQAVIFYDAAYEAYINDKDAARSIFEVAGARDCAVEFCSFSKMAGFTGVRCGWTVIPMVSPLNRMWLHRQAIKFNGTSYIVQRMAESMLRGGGYEDSKKMVAAYKKNASIITKKFDELGIEYTGGINAPYIWFFCGIDSWEFFDYLLKKARIVCTPGSGFGKNGSGWIRLTSFNSQELTEEAIKRFELFWKEFIAVRDKLFTAVR